MNNKRFKMTPTTPTTIPNLPTKKPPTTPTLNEIDEMIFSALEGKPACCIKCEKIDSYQTVPNNCPSGYTSEQIGENYYRGVSRTYTSIGCGDDPAAVYSACSSSGGTPSFQDHPCDCNPPPGGWGPDECPPPGCPASPTDEYGCNIECHPIFGCRSLPTVFEGAYHRIGDCQADGCLPCAQYDPQPCGGSCLFMWFDNCEGNAWSIVTDNCSSTRSHCESICSCAYPTFIGLYTGDTATTSCLLFGGV